jgi:hypothetical protein
MRRAVRGRIATLPGNFPPFPYPFTVSKIRTEVNPVTPGPCRSYFLSTLLCLYLGARLFVPSKSITKTVFINKMVFSKPGRHEAATSSLEDFFSAKFSVYIQVVKILSCLEEK